MKVDINTSANISTNATILVYSPHGAVSLMAMTAAILCVMINLTILIKLLFKPGLWSFVNLFLSILLGQTNIYISFVRIHFSV